MDETIDSARTAIVPARRDIGAGSIVAPTSSMYRIIPRRPDPRQDVHADRGKQRADEPARDGAVDDSGDVAAEQRRADEDHARHLARDARLAEAHRQRAAAARRDDDEDEVQRDEQGVGHPRGLRLLTGGI